VGAVARVLTDRAHASHPRERGCAGSEATALIEPTLGRESMCDDALARSGDGVSLSPAKGRGDVRLTPAGIEPSIAIGNGNRGARYFHTAATRRRAVRGRRRPCRRPRLDERIERTDVLIDELVYELYGPTDEAIAVVEEAAGD
jgi:hypothetical protein